MISTSLYEDMYEKTLQFSFWKNWKDYLKNLTEDRIEVAKASLLELVWDENKIKKKRFVDVGSWSGLFSLAAYLLWAEEVVSIDVDKNSIWCTNFLKEKYWNPKNWRVIQGSALDRTFIDWLWKFDIVYSWWVLHHSGNMHQAFDNVVPLIWNDGIFVLAIYNKFITSKIWWYIKYAYNKTPNFLKFIWVILHYIYVTIMYAIQGKFIISKIKEYQTRGMSFHTDVIDWLWWFPYEYMSTQEAISYFDKKWLAPILIKEAHGPWCWEIVFKKMTTS